MRYVALYIPSDFGSRMRYRPRLSLSTSPSSLSYPYLACVLLFPSLLSVSTKPLLQQGGPDDLPFQRKGISKTLASSSCTSRRDFPSSLLRSVNSDLWKLETLALCKFQQWNNVAKSVGRKGAQSLCIIFPKNVGEYK